MRLDDKIKLVKRMPLFFLVTASPLILLVLISQAAIAQGDPPQQGRPISHPGADSFDGWEPLGTQASPPVTRIQTVTLFPPENPVDMLIRTSWTNDWRDLPTPTHILYPSDVPSTELFFQTNPPTIPWEIDENYHAVFFYPPLSLTYDVLMVYTTYEGLNPLYRTFRLPNSSLVESHVGGWFFSGFSQFTTTLVYTSPYLFVDAWTEPAGVPTVTQGTNWIRWSIQDLNSFRGIITLQDTRLISYTYHYVPFMVNGYGPGPPAWKFSEHLSTVP